ncbi:MAG: cytochrome c biogenesis protein CcsA [Bacteroidales bacterium]|nr:cytochrome c biogenesis protein CcsA [Bacteroidales bacterium]
MITWHEFPYFAFASIIVWLVGIAAMYLPFTDTFKKAIVHISITSGIAAHLVFIVLFWTYIDRPPMRTLGETRLWYSLLIPIVGYLYYVRWRYNWVMAYSIMLSVVFMLINIFNPEIHDKTLMPALQSIWFVPHVIVYMFAYALLAVSCIIAIKGLVLLQFKKFNPEIIVVARSLVRAGFAFLTLGLLFGALWAKEAWGHYWTWDPKEVWALLTWLAYMLYLHATYYYPQKTKTQLWLLAIAFIVLLICWFGINYLATAQTSVHTYTQ